MLLLRLLILDGLLSLEDLDILAKEIHSKLVLLEVLALISEESVEVVDEF